MKKLRASHRTTREKCRENPLNNYPHFNASEIYGKTNPLRDAELFCRFGAVLGSQMSPGAKFLLSRDHRSESVSLLNAFANGLRATGTAVVNLGTLPACVMHYAARRTRADGCAMISAAGLAQDSYRIHWTLAHAAFPDAVPEMLKAVEEFTPMRNSLIGTLAQLPINAELRPDANLREALEALALKTDVPCPIRVAPKLSDARLLNVSFDYVAWLQDTWVDLQNVSQQIVLDPKYGIWAARARTYLQAVLPHSFITALRDIADPELAHESETQSGANTRSPLTEEVDRTRADLGFMLGEDGGQIQAVDGMSFTLTHEELTWIFLQSFAQSLEGQYFVHDGCCSSRIIAEAKRFGAEPVCVSMEEAAFRKKMLSTGAPFGAGFQGKHYFRAIFGDSDALFSVCWLVDFLDHSGKKLAQWRQSVPRFTITPELRVPFSAEKSQWNELLLSCSRNLKCTFCAEDQIRCELSKGWFFLAQAPFEETPSLLLRVEAEDGEPLENLVRQCCMILDEHENLGSRFWSVFHG